MNSPLTRRHLLRTSAAIAAGTALSSALPYSLFAIAPQSQPPADLVTSYREMAAKTPITATPLAPGITLLQGAGGNMAVLTGPEDKLLIDSSLLTAAPRLKEALAAIDDLPLKYVVNTHWHFDHTDGNAPMHEFGATIVSHTNTLKRLSTPQFMELMNIHFPAVEGAALPRRTFSDNLVFFHNGEEVVMQHFTPAHTDSDIYIHFTKANVLHVADIWFNGFYPLIDYSSGGNIGGMIAASNAALDLANDKTKIIPGHGPLGDKAALTGYRDMLVTVRDRVQKLKESGKSLDETIATKPTADLDAKWGGGMMKPEMFVTLVYKTA